MSSVFGGACREEGYGFDGPKAGGFSGGGISRLSCWGLQEKGRGYSAAASNKPIVAKIIIPLYLGNAFGHE
jgi:hypothetical protein